MARKRKIIRSTNRERPGRALERELEVAYREGAAESARIDREWAAANARFES
jgi:hypothetical protein